MKLQVKNICKTFTNQKQEKTVLDNISFNVKEGQFVTLNNHAFDNCRF